MKRSRDFVMYFLNSSFRGECLVILLQGLNYLLSKAVPFLGLLESSNSALVTLSICAGGGTFKSLVCHVFGSD